MAPFELGKRYRNIKEMMTGEKGLLKFLSPKLRNRLHPINIEAAVLWSVAGTATALWLVQVLVLNFTDSSTSILFVHDHYYFYSLLETEKLAAI